ncbi:MAG: hypothetical protein RMM08_13420, partial [Armatimonadota bacterium]|nr:hypothetical protein [Armatimonadota bacterium]
MSTGGNRHGAGGVTRRDRALPTANLWRVTLCRDPSQVDATERVPPGGANELWRVTLCRDPSQVDATERVPP